MSLGEGYVSHKRQHALDTLFAVFLSVFFECVVLPLPNHAVLEGSVDWVHFFNWGLIEW